MSHTDLAFSPILLQFFFFITLRIRLVFRLTKISAVTIVLKADPIPPESGAGTNIISIHSQILQGCQLLAGTHLFDVKPRHDEHHFGTANVKFDEKFCHGQAADAFTVDADDHIMQFETGGQALISPP